MKLSLNKDEKSMHQKIPKSLQKVKL